MAAGRSPYPGCPTGGQHLQFRFPFAPAPDVGRRALQKTQGQQHTELCMVLMNLLQNALEANALAPDGARKWLRVDLHNTPSQPGQETTEHRIAVPVLQRGADQQSGDGKTEHDPGVDGKIGKERDHRLKSRHDPIDQRGQDGERRKGFLPFSALRRRPGPDGVLLSAKLLPVQPAARALRAGAVGQHLQFRFLFASAPDVGRRALQKA